MSVALGLCSKAAIEDMQAQNLICILDVDIQGVRRIKETDLNPIYISIQPPSMDILVTTFQTSSLECLHTVVRLIKPRLTFPSSGKASEGQTDRN